MATEILRPNAAGDSTQLTKYPDSGANWDKVDEAVADDDTTYVKAVSTSYLRDLYNLPAHSVGSGTINSITIYFCIATALSNKTAYAKPSQKSGTTVTDGTEVSKTGVTTYETFSQTYTTNPATGAAYTWDEIDALQIGLQLKISSTAGSSAAKCTQVYVEVDYTTGGVTEKTSSDTGSGVDAYVSLETAEVKSSSDTGSGGEGTPMLSAILSGSEIGSAIEALVARLLATFDAGTGIEVGSLLKDLFATELGQGIDTLVVKREIFAGGEGTKFFGGGHEPPHRAS